MEITRRSFVRVGSVWVAATAVGCKGASGTTGPASSHEPTSRPAEPQPPAVPEPPPRIVEPGAPYGRTAPPEPEAAPQGACVFTENNIEGPYYRPGAPLRADLTDAGTAGVRLTVQGRVLDAGCTAPLAGATLDIWQANKDGQYDNDGHSGRAPGKLVLRGKVTTNERGEYTFKSIVPGRYLNGDDYRPAHVHVKVQAPGHAPLTTQLYFDGDPYNGKDVFIKRSLIMRLEGSADDRRARFDFVLRRA